MAEAIEMDHSAQRHYLKHRSLIYQLLARTYRRESDEEFLAKIAIAEMFSIMKVFSPQLNTAVFEITNKVRIDQLGVEFCRLFVGPCPLVPPYESVHRIEPGNAGQLWGEATVELKNLVKTFGLVYADDFNEMPDHISVEFELMYRLLNLEAEYMETGGRYNSTTSRSAQKTLFNEHIGIWLPEFCNKVETVSNDHFYIALARLTRDFIKKESFKYAN